MRRALLIALLSVVAAAALTPACHSIDDDRIPAVDVYLPFNTEPEWNTYGVTGACTSKRFIKEQRIPSSYPYPALSFTGFGGILLCSDIHGNPVAYDLACPVEVRQDVRVVVDTDLQKARCPKCGSVYEIYTNYGYPVEGPAAFDGFALRRYRVISGSAPYMQVVR